MMVNFQFVIGGKGIHNVKTELTAMPTDIVEDIDADMAPFPNAVEE
jgi:hypothetical protein